MNDRLAFFFKDSDSASDMGFKGTRVVDYINLIRNDLDRKKTQKKHHDTVWFGQYSIVQRKVDLLPGCSCQSISNQFVFSCSDERYLSPNHFN